jgi:carbon storage regulator
MLVLTRRLGESVIIEGGIHVTVVAVQGNKVRLGIVAPETVRVDRAEVHARRAEFDDISLPPVERASV